MNVNNAAIAQQLGYSKEEMLAKFGEPGEKSPEEIGGILGLANDVINRIFGTKNDETSSTTTTSNDSTTSEANNDNSVKTQDDKYLEVANALGCDAKSVSAVMKAIENGISGKPEEVVPKLAYDLGLPASFVSDVLKYLNNGQM